jgi:hypothetical protein
MAEFDYFLTQGEFVRLLEAAVVTGYVVHVKKHLPTPMPQLCRTTEEISAAVGTGDCSFLLERSDMSRYPIELIRVDKSGSQFWYPRPKEGGPVIEAYFYPPFEKGDRRVVPCSLLTYHAKIINPNTGQFEPAGDVIKSAFRSMISGLRKASRQVRAVKRSAFVSSGVDAMIKAGCVLAPPFDKA